MPDIAVEAFDLDGAARIRGAWQDLADRSLEPSVFSEPAFLLPAARHLGRSGSPTLLAMWRRPARATAELVGLCPIARPRWPGLLPARVWTHPQATAAVPLLHPDHAHEAFLALLTAAGQGRRAAAGLLMTGLDCNGPTAGLVASLGAETAWLDPRTRAVLPRDDAGAGLGGSGRKELRRQRNRLAEQGRLVIASATTPGDVAAALGGFLALEAKGWKGRRGTALGSVPGTRRFAEEALAGLATEGRCRIDTLALDGRPLATGIVLSSGDRAFFWKTAYDEDFARFSPGLQLASAITDNQRADPAVTVTDSCAIPGHSMIDRLWRSRWHVADCLVATRAGGAARFAQTCAAERSRRRIRAAAKRLSGLLRRR